jgi:hypothetical protein
MPDSGEYCLAREPSSDEYHWGFTMAYQFKDLDSGSNQSDVLLIYSDDRDSLGGSLSEVGRWTSGSDGILEGTVDSRTRTTGSSQDRPVVFVEKQLADFGSSRSSGVTDPPSVNQYTMEDITFNIEVRSYGHLEEPIISTLTTELGKMAGDYTVDEYREYLLKSDPGVTGTKAAADALTEIADLEDFYDRTKAEWRDEDDYPLPEKDGSYIDIGSTNLTIDLYAVGTAWAYSAGSSLITIYPGSDGIIDATSKYTGIKTTGTITLANGADTDAILVDSSGSRVFVTLTNVVVGSRYQIYKTSDQSVIAQGEATSSTITEPYIWTTDTAVTIVIRQSSFSQRYIPYITSGTITQSGLAIVVSQIEDTLASELAAFTQLHFRWRNDDDDEGDATWKQNEDINHTGQAKLENIRIRISVDETYGVTGSITPTLQYRKVGDSTWDDV